MTALTLYEFKTKHGLSNGDIQMMTGLTAQQLRDIYRGADDAPVAAMMVAHSVDIVIDRIKTQAGVFTTNDAYHAAHIIGEQNRVIDQLKAGEIPAVCPAKIQSDASECAESLLDRRHLTACVPAPTIQGAELTFLEIDGETLIGEPNSFQSDEVAP